MSEQIDLDSNKVVQKLVDRVAALSSENAHLQALVEQLVEVNEQLRQPTAEPPTSDASHA